MSESWIIQGRSIGAAELAQVRQLLAAHPQWHRTRLSRQLAQQWDWRNLAGQLKDMAARTFLLKLQQRGWITLPPCQRPSPNRMRPKPVPALEWPLLETPITGPLVPLLPLVITEVSTPAGASQRPRLEGLLHQHHYLSHRSWVGQNVQYLARDRQGRPLAGVLFGAAAWQCAARDHYLGWSRTARPQRLHLLANNARFLILPWVQVPRLASYLLSRIALRLSRDWQAKYGHPIYLLETFVQRDRFDATAYQAAHWRCVGQTQGRTRQDRADGAHQQVPLKDVYLYPLHPDFRNLLQSSSQPKNPPKRYDHPPGSAPTQPAPRSFQNPQSPASSPGSKPSPD